MADPAVHRRLDADDARPRHVRVELQSAARPASAARRAVAEQCGGRVPPELVEDLRVIASELVANVLQHGGGADGLTLDVTIRDHEVDIQVVGRGDRRSLPPSAEWRLPPASEQSGRGLAIVRRLATWIAIDGDEPVHDRQGWIGITASVPVSDRSDGLADRSSDDPSANDGSADDGPADDGSAHDGPGDRPPSADG